MRQVVLDQYPMTIPMLSEWARAVSSYDTRKCAIALNKLAFNDPHEPRRVWKRGAA